MAKKNPTKAEKLHLDKVASLGCIACKNALNVFSPAEIHHIRSGQGAAQRASHRDTLPLCPQHHRTGGHGVAIHAGIETWQKIFGTERELLEQVNQDLGLRT